MENCTSIYSFLSKTKEILPRKSTICVGFEKSKSKDKTFLSQILERIEREKRESLFSTKENTFESSESKKKANEIRNYLSIKERNVMPMSSSCLIKATKTRREGVEKSKDTMRGSTRSLSKAKVTVKKTNNTSLLRNCSRSPDSQALSKVKARVVPRKSSPNSPSNIKIDLKSRSKDSERKLSTSMAKSPNSSYLKLSNELPKRTAPRALIPHYMASPERSDCNYTYNSKLGFGSFATVWLVTHRQSKEQFAMKVYEKSRLTQTQRECVKREASIAKNLRHENIIQLKEVIETEEKVCLVFEYFQGITLGEALESKPSKRFSEKEASKIFKQITSGLLYLHSLSIAHRDLKLENVLVKPLNHKIKIIDFGFAVQSADSSKVAAFCGSPCYMAPEILNLRDSQREFLAEAADLWALGIILFALLTGEMPFKAGKNRRELFKAIGECDVKFPRYISRANRFLLEKILVKSPQQRMAVKSVLFAI